MLAVYEQNLPTASQSEAAASHQQRHGNWKKDATLKDEKMKTPSMSHHGDARSATACLNGKESHGQEGFQTWARIFRGHEPWTVNSKQLYLEP